MSKKQYVLLMAAAMVAGLVGCGPTLLDSEPTRSNNCLSRAQSYLNRTNVHDTKVAANKVRVQLQKDAVERSVSGLTKEQERLRQQSVAGVEGAGRAWVNSLTPEQQEKLSTLFQELEESDREAEQLNQEALQLLQEKTQILGDCPIWP